MNIDPKTMLFRHLTSSEKEELTILVRELVLEGKMPPRTNKFVKMWMDYHGYGDREFLLTITTAFPSRALLSVLS